MIFKNTIFVAVRNFDGYTDFPCDMLGEFETFEIFAFVIMLGRIQNFSLTDYILIEISVNFDKLFLYSASIFLAHSLENCKLSAR